MDRRVTISREFLAPAALVLVITALAIAGWRSMLFLTDDAFIAFRYVSNGMNGLGFVWNPPPFRPVEGYTSFLWVVLLKWTWQITGVSPPVASNYLSLLFGAGTLVLGYRLVAGMKLPERLARHRFAFVALVLFGTVTNRTFLTWLSSGLETSLFNFCFTLWLTYALRAPERRNRGWVFWLSLGSSLVALTRPDGLLVLFGTIVLLVVHFVGRGSDVRPRFRQLAWALPLVAPLVHLAWRRATYGEWLPNTYYAKVVSAWPQSGVRYAASFILEYAVWIWILFALLALLRNPRMRLANVVVVLVTLAHLSYYTFAVGGDHFEYRVYSHVIVLLFVSMLWYAGRLNLAPSATFLLFAVFTISSWALPWVHHWETRDLVTRKDTFTLIHPVAHRFPAVVRPYAQRFDDLQEWLIKHAVCMRHQEHKIYLQHLASEHPSREEGAKLRWNERPVLAVGHVGMSGWVLPNVAIIDVAGLNDYVVARMPPRTTPVRRMAHERAAAKEYIDCYRPNVRIGGGKVFVHERSEPLTDEQVHACEETFLARASGR